MKKNFAKPIFIAIAYACTISLAAAPSMANAQPVLFDFDNAPLHSSFPLSLTQGAITAHFSATGFYGYSIQDANVLGFTPPGFAGRIIYPNSIYLADLLINFDQTLSDFSIMYSCQELACDDAATMRVTAFMNGTLVGTNTHTAIIPGTWPVDTLSCSFPAGFDSIVIHYDSPPPTCQDYGVIYMADNMYVTQLNTGIADQQVIYGMTIDPNPVSESALISFSLSHPENISVNVYDLSGRFVENVFEGSLEKGMNRLRWNPDADITAAGIYFLKISGRTFTEAYRMVVIK